MSDKARRTGLIARKVGMTQVFGLNGEAIPVTLLKIDENYVLSSKTKEKHGYSAVVMCFGDSKPNRVSKSVAGICAKAGLKPTKRIKEFRVSEDALLEVGKKIAVDHFVVGQLVDIQGKSVGKGTAGGMKRHNFRGLEASHGVSISHRSIGSTGNRQDPGRTFKGKKMPGHLGCETTTIQNVRVVFLDKELGLIGVNGSVPGKSGSYVYMSDAVKVILPSSVSYPSIYDEESISVVEGADIAIVEEGSDLSAVSANEAAVAETNN